MTFVMARSRNKEVALKPEGADGETTGGAVVVSVEVSVLVETAEELENGVLRPELTAVLGPDGADGDSTDGAVVINVNIEVSVLGDTTEAIELGPKLARLVLERDEARLGLELENEDEETFALGTRVTKVVGEVGTMTLLGNAPDELDNGIELEAEIGLDDRIELDGKIELEVRFKLSEGVTVGGIPGVEMRLAVAKDVSDDDSGDATDELETVLDKLEVLDGLLTKLVEEFDGIENDKAEEVRLGEMAVGAEADGTEGPVSAALELLGKEPTELEVAPELVDEPLRLALDGDGDGDTADEPLVLVDGVKEVDGTLLGNVGDSTLAVDGDKDSSEEADSGTDVEETGGDVIVDVEAYGTVEEFGKDTVTLPLVGIDGLSITDDEPGDDVGIVGCMLGPVLVGVVKGLEPIGEAGLGVAPEALGIKVLVMTVVEPPDKVLVNVVVTLDISGKLEDDGKNAPGIDGDMLTIVVVGPPGIVLVRVIGVLDVVGAVGPKDDTGGAPLKVVVEMLVNMAVDPPGIDVVIVISTVEFVMDETLGKLDGPETVGVGVVLYGIDDGTIVVSSVETVVESPLLIVTRLVDTKEDAYDGYGPCG
jgi:hypothetical protein